MRTCVWCGKPLPESTNKGHRRREFCNNTCKQHHYLWHQQMRHDADALAEPYWRTAYQALVEQYKWLENMVQARLLVYLEVIPGQIGLPYHGRLNA